MFPIVSVSRVFQQNTNNLERLIFKQMSMCAHLYYFPFGVNFISVRVS